MNPQVREIKRLASEMAVQLKTLTLSGKAINFPKQTEAKIAAIEGLKVFQECDIYNLQKAYEG